MARTFLVVVGVAYLGLGVWCATLPERSSDAVGFTLQPGQGQSEFVTVYGGLEVGLGLVFLWPVLSREDVTVALRTCLLVHLGLVIFRTIAFSRFSGFETTTYTLAATEWLIFLTAAALSRSTRQPND